MLGQPHFRGLFPKHDQQDCSDLLHLNNASYFPWCSYTHYLRWSQLLLRWSPQSPFISCSVLSEPRVQSCQKAPGTVCQPWNGNSKGGGWLANSVSFVALWEGRLGRGGDTVLWRALGSLCGKQHLPCCRPAAWCFITSSKGTCNCKVNGIRRKPLLAKCFNLIIPLVPKTKANSFPGAPSVKRKPCLWPQLCSRKSTWKNWEVALPCLTVVPGDEWSRAVLSG